MKEKLKELVLADQAWLNLSENQLENIKNPLSYIVDEDPLILAKNLLKIMSRTEYLHTICKMIMNVQTHPFQNVVLQELWERPFPMLIASRGGSKTFTLALYCHLKALLNDGIKIVVVGSGFRQSKLIVEYMETIWKNAPVFRDICSKESGLTKDVDRHLFRINNSTVIAIPIGDGSKIRGLRANIIVADEFNSIRADIYETVISGFAAVSSSPVENVIKSAKEKFLKEKGLWLPEHESLFKQVSNQSIIAGTPGYDFETFSQYWKRYKRIVESAGEKKKLEEIFNGEIPDNFNWRDYSVIRIPYELLPKGFMDDKTVSRAKATIDKGIYLNEYGSCFAKDSMGFFRRSLIESCVTSDLKPIRGTFFDAATSGSQKLKYIFGVDPASEKDNFAISILELHPDHSRVVYVWTFNRASHVKLVEQGVVSENNFYAYCARKIRRLMTTFPCLRIGIDQEGGGRAVLEALHDKDKILPGEQLIWPIIDPEKESSTDLKEGLHIVELINFSKADWVNEANHGLKKDMEDKALLFPRFDNLALGLAAERDNSARDKIQDIDYLETCIYEIEELKNELSTIVHTKSDIAGRDRFDTPEIKIANGKKGRMRKDRYSALLIANMLARQSNRADSPLSFSIVGRAARTEKIEESKKQKTIGNSLYNVGWNTFKGIRRG